MSKLFVDEIVHQSSQGSGTITIGASGETTNIVGTLQNNGAGVGGTNTPAFQAKLSASQSFSQSATFKVDFDHEVFDTAGAYDPTTNQRFTVPSGQAGKYYIHARIFYNDINSTDAYQNIYIYKNGSSEAVGSRRTVGTTGRDATVSVSQILDLSVSDYVEIYAVTNAGNGSLAGSSSSSVCIFEGYKIIE